MSIYSFDSTGTMEVNYNPDYTKCTISFRETKDSSKYSITLSHDDIEMFNQTKDRTGTWMIQVRMNTGTIIFRGLSEAFAKNIQSGLLVVFRPRVEQNVQMYVK